MANFRSAEKPLSPQDADWLDRPEVQRAQRVVRAMARNAPPEIRPAQNLELDLGFDSMQRVELLSALEQEFGGEVQESRLSEIYTVRELVDAVLEGASRQTPGTPGAANRMDLHFAGRSQRPRSRGLGRAQARSIELFWFFLSRLLQIFSLDRFQLQVTDLRKTALPRTVHSLFQPSKLSRSGDPGQRIALGNIPRHLFPRNQRNFWLGIHASARHASCAWLSSILTRT